MKAPPPPTRAAGVGRRGSQAAATAHAVGNAAEKAEQLRVLDETQVKGCRECRLCEGRTQRVFGQGRPSAALVFVGVAP